MTNKANYKILEETPDHILIQDIGPWDKFKTVTNAAEEVVTEMLPLLGDRRLDYIDSEGERATLVIRRGKFTGFAHKL